MKAPPSTGVSLDQFSMPVRMSREKRSMSAHERRKQRELAERIRKDHKNQEDLKRDAQALVNVLKV